MSHDQWALEVARKHSKRTGIFRVYTFDMFNERARLNLELVIRGKVKASIPLWRTDTLLEDYLDLD